jgi:hypothetical protein
MKYHGMNFKKTAPEAFDCRAIARELSLFAAIVAAEHIVGLIVGTGCDGQTCCGGMCEIVAKEGVKRLPRDWRRQLRRR